MHVCVLYEEDPDEPFSPAEFLAHYPCDWEMIPLKRPVRDKIIRNKSEWVPAVLRYNSIPAKILLEVCNLANEQDRRLIQTRAYRQKVADSVVQGLLAYYGQDAGPGGGEVAKAK